MNTNRRESAPTDDVSDDLERKKEQTKTSFLKPCNDEQNIKFSLTQMAYRNQTLNIESSSLIESPVVSAVLISHGLLENGLHLFENSGVKIKTETKFTDESKIHQNQHRESSYKCQWLDCEQLCIDRDELAEHVNWNHIQQGSDAEYHCQWIGCKRQGKGFNARYKMLMHMRCHTNEKPHVCACGKRFARLENLKIHMRCHTGEKPYVCHVEGCGKAYTNSSDRFKHTRTHFVEKPYVCKVEGCSKRYTDPSSLRKHRKTCGHYQNNTEQNIHFETHKLESYSDKNSSEIKVDKSCTFLTGHQGKVPVKPKVTKPDVLRPKSERSGVKWKHPFSEYSFYLETCHKLDNENFRYSNTSDKMTAVYSFSPNEVLPLDLSTTNSENVNSSDTESHLQSS